MSAAISSAQRDLETDYRVLGSGHLDLVGTASGHPVVGLYTTPVTHFNTFSGKRLARIEPPRCMHRNADDPQVGHGGHLAPIGHAIAVSVEPRGDALKLAVPKLAVRDDSSNPGRRFLNDHRIEWAPLAILSALVHRGGCIEAVANVGEFQESRVS